MALRDQPYMPLYVKDIMTDEKLIDCSASAHGVYLRLMCLMHKSDPYGTIVLKTKYNTKPDPISNFASQVVKSMPFDYQTVFASLVELLDTGCLIMEGDSLIQKRMVKDASLSDKRAESGRKGGKKSFAQAFAQANIEANDQASIEANSVIANVDVNTVVTLGEEIVQNAARESFDNAIWVENVCMANNLTKEDLKRWMARYNASICNDKIADFDSGKYRKMFGGWLSTQFAKGYTLPSNDNKGFSERNKTTKVLR